MVATGRHRAENGTVQSAVACAGRGGTGRPVKRFCGCLGKRRWWLRRGVDGRILETEVKDELNSRGC